MSWVEKAFVLDSLQSLRPNMDKGADGHRSSVVPEGCAKLSDNRTGARQGERHRWVAAAKGCRLVLRYTPMDVHL